MYKKIWIKITHAIFLVSILFTTLFFVACSNEKFVVNQEFLDRYRNTEIQAIPTELLYASEDIVIVYDEYALIVYDLNKMSISGALDLKGIGMNHLQGSKVTSITVSFDGSVVYLENNQMESSETNEKDIYNTDSNKLIQVDSFESNKKDLFKDYYERNEELEEQLEFVKKEINSSGLNLIKLNEEKWIYLKHGNSNTYDGLEIVIWTPNNRQTIPVFNQ